MKKVTMKDFRWLGKPQHWEKTYKDLSLTVEGNLCLPEGPLLLAVSDEDFTLTVQTTTAPKGGYCGVCLYHTERTYTAVGRSKAGLCVETSINSYKTTADIPIPTDEENIRWHLERRANEVRIGYSEPLTAEVQWICSTSLPGMKDAISFGAFFTNHTNTPFNVKMHSLRYVKNEVVVSEPLV